MLSEMRFNVHTTHIASHTSSTYFTQNHIHQFEWVSELVSFNLVGLNLTEIFQFNWLKLHSQLHCYTVWSRSAQHTIALINCARKSCWILLSKCSCFHISCAHYLYSVAVCGLFSHINFIQSHTLIVVCRVLSSRQMKLKRWCAREHFHALNSQTITNIECIALHC